MRYLPGTFMKKLVLGFGLLNYEGRQSAANTRCVATGRWGIEWVPQNQPMTWMFDCLAQRLDGTIASHTSKDPVNSAIDR